MTSSRLHVPVVRWGWPHFAEIDEIRKKADGTNRSRPFTIDLWCRCSRPVHCRHSCGCNGDHLPYFGIDSRSRHLMDSSVIYGIILWIWWAEIAYLLWRTGDRYPLIFRASVPNLLFQILLGVFVCALHLDSLHLTTRIMGRIWEEWHVARFDTLHFFEIGRYSLDFLVYALVWSACAIIRLHITAQRVIGDITMRLGQSQAANLDRRQQRWNAVCGRGFCPGVRF